MGKRVTDSDDIDQLQCVCENTQATCSTDQADLQWLVTCTANKTTRAATSSLVTHGKAAFALGCCFPSAGMDRSTDGALLRR